MIFKLTNMFINYFQNESIQDNRKEVHQEYTKKRTDHKLLANLERKKEKAEQELTKLELEEKGEDFDRRQAWDWTIEESEKWDEKMKAKKERIETSKFSDYSTAAERAYLKDLKDSQIDLDTYRKKKMELIKENATLIEDEDGNIIAYDSTGSLTNSSPIHSGPSKEAVDRLVNQLHKGYD